jgi:hypothetical protein
MTLILERATYEYQVQITDRLLTYAHTISVIDRRSNKNLIFRPRDAVVAVAYTGVGYIAGQPTDNWIAGVLAGEPEMTDSMLRITAGVQKSDDLATAVRRLQTRLNEQLAGSQPFFELNIIGWYQPDFRRPPRPILWLLTKKESEASVVFDSAPRHALNPVPLFGDQPANARRYFSGELAGSRRGLQIRHFLYASPPGNVRRDEIKAISRDTVGRQDEPDVVEEQLVEGIRRIADSYGRRGIGKDCVSILLPPPWVAPVRVRFWPVQPSTASVRVGAIELVRPVVYTPWLIGPHLIMAPSVVSGSGPSSTELDGINVVIVGPPSDSHPGIATMSRQERPPSP